MGTFAHAPHPLRSEAAELERLADVQAALRRVATLVARGVHSTELCRAVAQEVAGVLNLVNAAVCRYDDDATMTVLAAYGRRPDVFFAPGARWPLDGPSVSADVLRTGRPARIEDYTHLQGTLAATARTDGFDKVVGVPIMVDGRVWGVVLTASSDAPFPEDTEDRLAEFTELLATAIANGDAHEQLTRLAREQAALRGVATLVAEGAAPAEVFERVSEEVAHLIPTDGSALTRFENDGTVTALGGWTSEGGYRHVGIRYPLVGTVSGRVRESGRPERVDSYAIAPGAAPVAAREMGWRSSVGAPITVDGRLWGVLAVASKSERPLPPDTERRLEEFTDLVATAVANAESREELAGLSDEQAALRRVATLVAEGAPSAEVFEAVTAEAGRLIPADAAQLGRYETDATLTLLGGWANTGGNRVDIGERFPVSEGTLSRLVFETHRPARIGGHQHESRAGDAQWGSRVGAPIVVEGRLWGVLNVSSRSDDTLPPETEARLTEFTELVATAISNAETRAELKASRARIVATADATRRRIERDLHDGAQQQLLSLALELRAAEAAAPPELHEHRGELSLLADGLTGVLDELREIALGVHPAILAEGGLGPALKTLAHRSAIPVLLDVELDRRPAEHVEVAAYYVVSEALTNAAKHAQASLVHVAVQQRGDVLGVEVRDDGIGGADSARGAGLLALKDRAEANGGRLHVDSPAGGGTSLTVELPFTDNVA
jgi:signal transduction histidine kinase